mgnify:CR=1 FL=1|jgi:hypothetical protein
MSTVCLHKRLRIADTKFIMDYVFENGHTVPVFDVYSTNGLNQIIGHAKFNNKDFANVYYRGECSLHSSIIPSLFRGCIKTSKARKLHGLIERIRHDDKMKKTVKLGGVSTTKAIDTAKVEGMLQHYGVKTRFVDLVDNHWVALWMGNNRYTVNKCIDNYCHYYHREITVYDMVEEKEIGISSMYQYVLLLAIPFADSKETDGVKIYDEFIEVNLRKALPSIFLRPHAQHGIVVRKKVATETLATDYDLSSQVIGILRIRIDRATQWLGNGELLSQSNLFPPSSSDYGYDILLSRTDLFVERESKIAKFC